MIDIPDVKTKLEGMRTGQIDRNRAIGSYHGSGWDQVQVAFQLTRDDKHVDMIVRSMHTFPVTMQPVLERVIGELNKSALVELQTGLLPGVVHLAIHDPYDVFMETPDAVLAAYLGVLLPMSIREAVSWVMAVADGQPIAEIAAQRARLVQATGFLNSRDSN